MLEIMIWFTADLHLSHKNILDIEGRPAPNGTIESHNELLIQLYNQCVAPADTAYILGDFAFTNTSKRNEFIARMNGRKIFVVGNHDSRGGGFDYGFNFACYEMKLRINGQMVTLSHYPFRRRWYHKLMGKYDGRYEERRPRRDTDWLIHGHVHRGWKILDGQINVGVDAWNYRPVSMDTIYKIMNKNMRNLSVGSEV